MANLQETLFLSDSLEKFELYKARFGLNTHLILNFSVDNVDMVLKKFISEEIKKVTVISTNPTKTASLVKIVSALFTVEHLGFDGLRLIKIEQATEIQKQALMLICMPKSGTEYIRQKIEMGLMTSDRKVFGGTWAEKSGQQLSIPLMRGFLKQGGLSQNHIKPSNFNVSLLKDMAVQHTNFRIMLHLRDPRQAFVSFLEFYPKMPTTLRKSIDNSLNISSKDDVHAVFFKHFYQNMIDFASGWLKASESKELNNRIFISTHEKLVTDPLSLSKDLCQWLKLEPDTIDFSTRPSQGKSHFRKGRTSEWREYFSAEKRKELNEVVDSNTFKNFGWDKS